jgi:hypothetical protein
MAVFALGRSSHYVDAHKGTKHDERCQCIGKTRSTFDTLIPNHFGIDDFSIKLTFYHILELMKLLENIRLMVQQINPCESAKVINEAHIITILA